MFKSIMITTFSALALMTNLIAGEAPKMVIAFQGSTPTLDGIIQNGEWDDCDMYTGVKTWESDTKPPSQDSLDLSVKMWIKHDGTSLYFAFDVMDDVLYGFDINRWVHANNPDANEMSPKGWPWWGDGVEIMMNSTYKWQATGGCAGDGRSWQVVTSTHKSTLHGLEQGGLMAGEPRATAWNVYEQWAANGDMQVAVRLKDKTEGRGYVIEWRINPNPCMQIDENSFFDLSKAGMVGLNIEIQDLDEQEKGAGNWSNMHHIDYLSKVGSNSKTDLRSFSTLSILPEKLPSRIMADKNNITTFQLAQNVPNPFNPTTTINYVLPHSASVQIGIYNTQGQLVRSLVNSHQARGSHSALWDARDDSGRRVASGIYFYKMSTPDFTKTRKLLLVE